MQCCCALSLAVLLCTITCASLCSLSEREKTPLWTSLSGPAFGHARLFHMLRQTKHSRSFVVRQVLQGLVRQPTRLSSQMLDRRDDHQRTLGRMPRPALLCACSLHHALHLLFSRPPVGQWSSSAKANGREEIENKWPAVCFVGQEETAPWCDWATRDRQQETPLKRQANKRRLSRQQETPLQSPKHTPFLRLHPCYCHASAPTNI